MSGIIDYSSSSGSYDYVVDSDVTSSVSSSNINNAVEADRAMNAMSENNFTIPDVYNDTETMVGTMEVGCDSEGGGAHYPSNMLIIAGACAFVIAILGSFGNLLTIIALPMSKKLRTTATAFVVNLAVVELLFCALILPMSGAQYLHLQRTQDSLLDNNDCIFFTITRYTLTQVELQTILAIALTRALAVAVPRMYTFLNRSSVIGCYITFIWVYSFVIRMPTAFGVFGKYGYNRCTMECDMVGSEVSDKIARLVMIVIEAVIPVPVIILLYLFVFIMVIRRSYLRSRKFSKPIQPQPQVKRSSNRVAKASVRNNSTKIAPPTSSGGSTSSTAGERKGSNSSFKSLKRMVSESSIRARFVQLARTFNETRTHQSSTVSQRLCTNRRDMRVARTIFIIFILLLVCSVPVATIHALDRNVKYPVQFLVLHILYWVQYSINVLVYVFMNRQYRDAYVDCLARVFPQFQRHHGKKFPWEKASISSKPPQNLPTSTRPRLDSADQVVDSTASEPEPVAATAHAPPIGVQGRLSTIPEGNSSSAANDSVFSDPLKKEREELEKRALEEEAYYEDQKCFESDASDSENDMPEAERKALMDKEHWVTQNGSTGGNLPNDESKV